MLLDTVSAFKSFHYTWTAQILLLNPVLFGIWPHDLMYKRVIEAECRKRPSKRKQKQKQKQKAAKKHTAKR